MNLILFLGSGVSYASNAPSVVDLTVSLVTGTSSVNPFLSALYNFDEKTRAKGGTYKSGGKYSFSGEIYRTATTYEDLFYLCQEIQMFSMGLHSGSILAPFVESLIKNLDYTFTGETENEQLIEIGHLASAAKKYIEQIVIKSLATPPKITGLDSIVGLAKSKEIKSLNILTLNHDLLVERILSQNNIKFIDGFGAPDGDIRWFDPNTFLSKKKIKLLKLHGSIDWYSFQSQSEVVAKVNINDAHTYINSKNEKMELTYAMPNVLSGLNKVVYYNMGMYTDIFYFCQKAFHECNIMVMSGYGWGDEGINNRIDSWLYSKPENKLILLHNDSIEKIKNRTIVLARAYDNLISVGKIVLIQKWLSQISTDEILAACK